MSAPARLLARPTSIAEEIFISDQLPLRDVPDPFYTNGIGGLCDGLFEPPVSFWCNPRNPRDGLHGVWNGTGGLVFNSSMLPAAAMSANLSHARAHVWSVSAFHESYMY